MREPRPLPVEARRAAWDRLWRILLAPPASGNAPEDPAPPAADDPRAPERGGVR